MFATLKFLMTRNEHTYYARRMEFKKKNEKYRTELITVVFNDINHKILRNEHTNTMLTTLEMK